VVVDESYNLEFTWGICARKVLLKNTVKWAFFKVKKTYI
jgi:hypothetical protein